MSEPVTHAEIEDVLSSIRRLVSEDGRDTPAVDVLAPEKKSAPRLVLTPSLRVADAALDADLTEPARDHSDTDRVEVAEKSEPDTGLSELTELQDDLVEHEAFSELENPSVAPEEQVMLGDDSVLQPVDPDEEENQAEQAASDDAPWRDPDATLFAAAGVAEVLAESVAEAPGEASSPVSFADKIAALEAVIGQADEQWEPDGETGEENSGTPVETLAWEDLETESVEPDQGATEDVVEVTSEADPTPEFVSPEASFHDAEHLAEQAVSDEVLDRFSADETVMDEESLRELVADIVREELQGALGERITRNVRKLVRREIHRALAVQDLG